MKRWLAMLWLCLGSAACTWLPTQTDEPLPLAARVHPESFVVVTVRNDGGPITPRAGSTIRGYDGTAARYGVGSSARGAVKELASTHRLKEISSWPIPQLGIHCVVFELPADQAAPAVLERLKRDARVESAQPLQSFATQSDGYNDPYQSLQSSLATMGVIAAHRWSRGAGVRVAVIDTGVDITHPDLFGRIAEHRNFVDEDRWSFNHDRHGTAVAGVIAADSDNAVGIVGVAPQARLYVYKVCWQQAAGASCNTFTLAKALVAAIDAGVQIVNLSLAGPADPLLTRLVVAGQQHGIVFVGATPPAGAADEAAAAIFPSSIEGVLKVAAVEHHSADRATLLAPGTEVLTLVPQGHYDFISGSSLATANVAGIVALLMARDRKINSDRLQQLLLTTARRAPDSDVTEGGVNACDALAALLNQRPCP